MGRVPVDVVPMQASAGSAVDPLCRFLGWAGIQIAAADPGKVRGGTYVVANPRRFGQVAEVLAGPGRTCAVVDLSVAEGRVEYRLAFGAAAYEAADAGTESAALAGTARAILSAAPTTWTFSFIQQPDSRTAPPLQAVRVVQQAVEVDDQGGCARAVSRFERRSDHGGTLLSLLADHGCAIRVGVLATRTHDGDLFALTNESATARGITERHAMLPRGQEAARVHATLLEAGGPLKAQVFAVEVFIRSPVHVPASALRAIASQLLVGLDIIHLGEHGGRRTGGPPPPHSRPASCTTSPRVRRHARHPRP